ncbi:unnamed protein product, partial [Phaeothamnion confervicola]
EQVESGEVVAFGAHKDEGPASALAYKRCRAALRKQGCSQGREESGTIIRERKGPTDK